MAVLTTPPNVLLVNFTGLYRRTLFKRKSIPRRLPQGKVQCVISRVLDHKAWLALRSRGAQLDAHQQGAHANRTSWVGDIAAVRVVGRHVPTPLATSHRPSFIPVEA